MTARLAGARARRRWRFNTCPHILFSDESRFSLRFNDGHYRVYRRRGECFTNQYVYESGRFGGGTVMVWAEICHDDCTRLKIVQGTYNAVKYRDDILDPIILPFLQQRNFDHVFKHDNARCHVACACQDFLNQNHIRVLPWLALSPDMSPIEELFDELSGRVRRRQNAPEALQELSDATSLYPTVDWFYASEMRSCRCCKRWSHTLLNSTNFHTA